MAIKRYGWGIGLFPEKVAEYKKLHMSVWPDVLKRIKDCNIQNYSIYLRQLQPGQFFLFSYLEYTGSSFEMDMAKMAEDPATQKWWALCKPCQEPISTAKPNEWWADMEEVFHID